MSGSSNRTTVEEPESRVNYINLVTRTMIINTLLFSQ